MKRRIFLALPAVAVAPLAASTRLLDPSKYDHEYDPKEGNLGRGFRNVTAAEFDLSAYEPWTEFGQSVFDVYGPSGLPTGWQYRAYLNPSTNRVISFEYQPSLEERRAMLDEIHVAYSPSGLPNCRKAKLRDLLIERGFTPEQWLAGDQRI